MTDAKKRRLTVAADETGALERHPDDGWKLAEPMAVGRATERVARAIVRALLPPPPAPSAPDMEDRVFRHMCVMLQYMEPFAARGFLFLLHFLNWSPLWRFRGLRPLTALPSERAAAILQEMVHSRVLLIRMMMLGPKGLILSTYFDQDVVHEALDYEPRGFMKERIALRRRLLAGERAGREDNARPVMELQ